MTEVICKHTAAIIVINEKIAKLEAQRTQLQNQRDNAELIASVGKDFVVTFKVGRAETRRELEGVVLGRGEVKGVDCVRVQTGEGFDLEVHTVKVAELLTIKAPVNLREVADATVQAAAAGDAILSSVLG